MNRSKEKSCHLSKYIVNEPFLSIPTTCAWLIVTKETNKRLLRGRFVSSVSLLSSPRWTLKRQIMFVVGFVAMLSILFGSIAILQVEKMHSTDVYDGVADMRIRFDGSDADGLEVLKVDISMKQLLKGTLVLWMNERICFRSSETELLVRQSWIRSEEKVSEKIYCERPLRSPFCAPSFFLIGPYKSGTTSIFKYLSKHPQVKFPSRMAIGFPGVDPNFVMMPDEKLDDIALQNDDGKAIPTAQNHTGVYDEEAPPNYTHFKQKELHFFDQELPLTDQDIEKYLKLFPNIRPDSHIITGDGTPTYLTSSDAPERISKILPKSKMIVMMRDPVERAISQNCHHISLERIVALMKRKILTPDSPSKDRLEAGLINSSINRTLHYSLKILEQCMSQHVDWAQMYTCITKGSNPQMCLRLDNLLLHAIYDLQISHWFKYFPRDQFLFIPTNDLKKNATQVMNRVTKFLGIATIDWETITQRQYDVGINPYMYLGSDSIVILDDLSNFRLKCPKPPQETINALERFYHNHTLSVFKLLGQSFW